MTRGRGEVIVEIMSTCSQQVAFLSPVCEELKSNDFCLHSAPDLWWKLGGPMVPLAKTRKAKIFPNKRIMSVVSVFPPHSAACPICLSRATTSSHAGSCLASLPSVHWPLSSQFLCWLQRALALKTREPKIFLGRGSHRLALGEQLRDWSYTRLLKEVKSTSNHSCKLLTHKSNQLAITVV